MVKAEDVFWFMEAEYDLIRRWVEFNESHRRDLERLNPGVKTPKIFVSFESYYWQFSGKE